MFDHSPVFLFQFFLPFVKTIDCRTPVNALFPSIFPKITQMCVGCFLSSPFGLKARRVDHVAFSRLSPPPGRGGEGMSGRWGRGGGWNLSPGPNQEISGKNVFLWTPDFGVTWEPPPLGHLCTKPWRCGYKPNPPSPEGFGERSLGWTAMTGAAQ